MSSRRVAENGDTRMGEKAFLTWAIDRRRTSLFDLFSVMCLCVCCVLGHEMWGVGDDGCLH
jgi:hypothetical protein